MRFNFSSKIFGLLLICAALFLVFNQIYSFTDIGFGKLVIVIIAVLVLINMITTLNFAFLPVPLAALYIILQPYIDFLPEIRTWTMILAAILVSVGLQIIFPKSSWRGIKFKGAGSFKEKHKNINTEDADSNNHHFVSVNFGAVSRRLHSNNLETVQLNCSFGAMEIFLDQAILNPNGAEVILNCSFGAIELSIPREWKVIDNINCSVGGVEIDRNFSNVTEDAPQVTITGSVSFGGVDIRRV